MTLQAGWLQRQLDHVADDVDKWPDWMKREAEFSSPVATAQEEQARSDTHRWREEGPS